MKRILLVVFSFVLFAMSVKSQKRDIPKIGDVDIKENVDSSKLRTQTNTGNPFISVEQTPEFPGGMGGFFNYLIINIRYPKEARKNKIEGKVFVSFFVDRDGSLTEIKVIKSVSPELDAEAVRLLQHCPRWRPGIQNGRAVRVNYTIPITFAIDEPKKQIATQVDTQKFSQVEQVPEFPGGLEAFGQYLGQNVKYPEAARRNNIQGRVIVTFVVEKDGSLTDIKVTKSLSKETDAEAVRVIGSMPLWKPGIQNGEPVRVQYSVPVTFSLNN